MPLTRMRGASASAIVWVSAQSPALDTRVGDEMRRQRPHPLVEHVDHRALGLGGQAAGELLDQHEGRAQVGLEMGVPGRARGGRASRRART